MALQVQSRQPGWLPPFITCNASDAEIRAIEVVFGPETLMFLCHWPVQRAWQKKVAQKVRL